MLMGGGGGGSAGLVTVLAVLPLFPDLLLGLTGILVDDDDVLDEKGVKKDAKLDKFMPFCEH